MTEQEENFFKEFKQLLEKYHVSSINYTRETPICFETESMDYSHFKFTWDKDKIQDFQVIKEETKTFNI